ncbi:MAG: hypothetical protein JJU36_18115 [Phycisphaeraceae bacterium]|nr:hypothetical protein [Phycisphaeraceae bacterium]
MYLSACYFRAQLYTHVPRQVRDDLAWMADHGTRGVNIPVLEQDLTAAVENLDRIFEAAAALGLDVWITPSRWGNLVAGAPKVPSILTACHHETWALKPDGQPYIEFLGPPASVHHPAVFEFFCSSLDVLLDRWPVAGIIWDEPKTLHIRDYSPSARAALGERIDDPAAQLAAQAGFFGRVNGHARAQRGDLRTALFIFGHSDAARIAACAAIQPLDEFGLDGRPWWRADGGMDDNGSGGPPSKWLLDQGPAFIEAARSAGKRSYALLENHALPASCHELIDRRLPEVLAMDWDHLAYYYYPRSCQDPDGAMALIGRHLKRLGDRSSADQDQRGVP